MSVCCVNQESVLSSSNKYYTIVTEFVLLASNFGSPALNYASCVFLNSLRRNGTWSTLSVAASAV